MEQGEKGESKSRKTSVHPSGMSGIAMDKRLCRDCGKPHLKDPNKKGMYCKDCIKRRAKERQRVRLNSKQPDKEFIPISNCTKCGREFTKESRLQQRCDKCSIDDVPKVLTIKREVQTDDLLTNIALCFNCGRPSNRVDICEACQSDSRFNPEI